MIELHQPMINDANELEIQTWIEMEIELRLYIIDEGNSMDFILDTQS